MSHTTLQYQKIKSIDKVMISNRSSLNSIILKTLQACSDIVGASLGPGGRVVVIERQETQTAPIITKDGVTIFRNLGFTDPTQQVIMEVAREPAIKTASDAGDGTTSTVVLQYAFVKHMQDFCLADPSVSPQKVMRILEKIHQNVIAPKIASLAMKPALTDEAGRKLLRSVAAISGNGDTELADAVLECYDIVGDEGNVTILEENGSQNGYRVEKVDGYPVLLGFEEMCGPFYDQFINDQGTQTSRIEDPVFILYHGTLSDFSILTPILLKIETEIQAGKVKPAIVVAAHKFEEGVLANMAKNFKNGMKIFPMKTAATGTPNSQYEFLKDLAALTGAQIADDLTLPLPDLELHHLGYGPKVVESGRFRTNIIGYRDELLILERVEDLQKQYDTASTSEYDRIWLRERIAKLSSGIARLVVRGATGGVTKEKRDRAEDAICAVRGALKYGALVGGGATLKHLAKTATEAFSDKDSLEYKVATEVMAKSLMIPVGKLYENAGYNQQEREEMTSKLSMELVYDLTSNEWIDPMEAGVLDSVPAVRDAIGNSLSTAALLGTCGGTVCYARDRHLEGLEARTAMDWDRDTPDGAI